MYVNNRLPMLILFAVHLYDSCHKSLVTITSPNIQHKCCVYLFLLMLNCYECLIYGHYLTNDGIKENSLSPTSDITLC